MSAKTEKELRVGNVVVDYPSPSVARIRIGDPQAKQSILDEATIAALEKVLTRIEAQISLQGVILAGCAPGRFLAGADVKGIEAVSDAEAGRKLAERGQALFQRIARLPWRTVAAIDGVCLGGGLELSLACKVRVATDSPKTQIGLPEVQLGILPGWGGTTRLPRLIGLPKALDWILTARRADARRALRDGVVDRIVAPEGLDAAALEAAEGKWQSKPRSRPISERLRDGTSIGRAWVARVARDRVRQQTGDRFPAPFAAIDVATRGLALSVDGSLALEAKAVGELVASPICKNLVRLFFLMESAKRQGDRERAAAATEAAVMGAGIMGGAIAALLAEQGIATRLHDSRAQALDAAVARLRERLDRRVRERRLEEAAARAVLDRFQPTPDGSRLGKPQIVVEAIVENLAEKKALLTKLAEQVPESCVLATNTSSLSVTELQSSVPHPERVVGIHFFNPVEKMPLVEVIRGAHTSEEAVAFACGLAVRLKKTPVVVADCPGFLVNRILAPYLAQAAALLREGLSISQIDRAAVAAGMPMGPFSLLDEVGLDTAAAASRVLTAAFGDRMAAGSLLEPLLAAKKLGRKSGSGFYQYEDHKKGSSPAPDPQLSSLLGIPWAASASGPKADLLQSAPSRLLEAIASEARLALAEGVAASAEEIDLACVLGFGYPPERGGPLR
ncbi:MAG: enoyl-CoA hydratase/isomerase family protein [Planctomycetes bacterium]|nr:enoyl-CoA hydratase/isomerase family protein [Planctomycetota bacterium]